MLASANTGKLINYMLDFTKRSIVFVALFKPKDRNICGVHQMLFETFSQIVSTDLDSFVTDSTVVIHSRNIKRQYENNEWEM